MKLLLLATLLAAVGCSRTPASHFAFGATNELQEAAIVSAMIRTRNPEARRYNTNDVDRAVWFIEGERRETNGWTHAIWERTNTLPGRP